MAVDRVDWVVMNVAAQGREQSRAGQGDIYCWPEGDEWIGEGRSEGTAKSMAISTGRRMVEGVHLPMSASNAGEDAAVGAIGGGRAMVEAGWLGCSLPPTATASTSEFLVSGVCEIV